MRDWSTCECVYYNRVPQSCRGMGLVTAHGTRRLCFAAKSRSRVLVVRHVWASPWVMGPSWVIFFAPHSLTDRSSKKPLIGWNSSSPLFGFWLVVRYSFSSSHDRSSLPTPYTNTATDEPLAHRVWASATRRAAAAKNEGGQSPLLRCSTKSDHGAASVCVYAPPHTWLGLAAPGRRRRPRPPASCPLAALDQHHSQIVHHDHHHSPCPLANRAPSWPLPSPHIRTNTGSTP